MRREGRAVNEYVKAVPWSPSRERETIRSGRLADRGRGRGTRPRFDTDNRGTPEKCTGSSTIGTGAVHNLPVELISNHEAG